MTKQARPKIILTVIITIAVSIVAIYYFEQFNPATEIHLTGEQGISDGPYIFLNGETASVKWVNNDSLHTTEMKLADRVLLHQPVNYKFKLSGLNQLLLRKPASYNNIERIAALSDVHGQYDLFIKLLSANQIIDHKGDWSFKNGHLVVIGDAFDRGDKVTETLWHIIKLSQQASKAGGQVHYLLGNHDIMVLNADLRYINEKYQQVEQLSGHSYDELFGQETFLGQWLRTCPVVLRINDVVFNHAGLSMDLVHQNQQIDQINTTFSEQIIDNHRDSIRANAHLSLLARSKGPIWYRGYFRDTTLTNSHIDSILQHFKAKHIVVGHTSMEQIEVRFDQRILAADTSIKLGENGELLIIEDNQFYRAGLNGEKQRLW
ncbi:metallophosphoesterase [Carboxylicivirga taeanensis]|uniref:metallophosphoesterase n=1 Tax=Carboxylicivirga taeanensis TaxID=1416875 RepID=UPI003F6E1745